MKKARIVTILFVVIITTIFGGCKNTEISNFEMSNIEKTILNNSKNFIKNEYTYIDTNYKNLTFEDNTEDECIYFSKNNERIGGISYAENKELVGIIEKQESPTLSRKQKLPNDYTTKLDSARKIVIKYLEESKIIKDSDKSNCKEALNEVSFTYGTFSEKYKNYGMITVDKKIYINAELQNYLNEYVLIHELIHIVQATTSKNSSPEYRDSIFSHGFLAEGITDVIAATIALDSGLDCMKTIQKSQYARYYQTVYVLMSKDKFNLQEAFYYPDSYKKLDEITSKNFSKAIFLSVYSLDETGYSSSNKTLCDYYLQK